MPPTWKHFQSGLYLEPSLSLRNNYCLGKKETNGNKET